MKKAIKFFDEEITRLENAPKINGCEMTDEWAEQIEICKTAKSAIEKQISQKPYWVDSVPHSRCPVCRNAVSVYIDSPKLPYCYWCGQALDWGETE